MLIRKNTKAFKTIQEIVNACRDRPDRESLIRLYITKAGDTVRDRISVEALEGEGGLFYEMNYQAVLGNLKSSNHQLLQSDETPGIYFFHSSSNKVWDENPFEFDEALKKEFGALPDLPVFRKKEKTEKYAFPVPKLKAESNRNEKRKTPSGRKKEEPKKSARVIALWPKQPDYKLKNPIHFTGLERITVRQAQLTKKDVLDYYNKIAEYLLPYLKDRPQIIRLYRDGQPGPEISDLESLAKHSAEEIPEWVRTVTVGKGREKEQLLLCNDKEHLLFYVEIGCLSFHAGHSRLSGAKTVDSPDYLILAIEAPDYELSSAVDVALAAKSIFTGMQLPSFVKTDGASGLHIYVPLDPKDDFEVARKAAGYLCRLVRLKVPEMVSIRDTQVHGYGKVSLDFQVNAPRQAVVAPYSLVVGPSANVATPLLWEDVADGLRAEAYDHETIFQRLKKAGDPFEGFLRKKVNAGALLKRIEENYSFLF